MSRELATRRVGARSATFATICACRSRRATRRTDRSSFASTRNARPTSFSISAARRLANVTVNGSRSRRRRSTAPTSAFRRAAIRAGENASTADFTTPIAPAGASIIRFHDDKDGSDYLYTLLVPADANQLFPCFDQPDLKARLTLALTVPRELARGRERRHRARRHDAAARSRIGSASPIRCTYLFAFAAGPWKRVTRRPTRARRLCVRALARARSRGRLAPGAGRIGARVAREVLRRAVSRSRNSSSCSRRHSRSAAWSIPAPMF